MELDVKSFLALRGQVIDKSPTFTADLIFEPTVRFLPPLIWLESSPDKAPPSVFSLWADVYPRSHSISCRLLFNV